MDGLRIAENFSLPYEAVTQTFAILAKRGVGKTYTAAVMVEEMLKAGLHVAVVDPLGVWWGLRASADGKSEGLPIAVLGGDHGDLPLTEDMGESVAHILTGSAVSLVIDLSHFRKAAQGRFMTAFAEALYHSNRAPLHLVIDEADGYAPQRPMKGQERMLGAMEDIVRRGRSRGLGVTLITQRAAVINKDVLTQVEVLVALRTIAPQDRDAVDAWVKVHGTPEEREQMMSSLPSLPIGTAWFWSPGWLDTFQQVQVRRRETFDSSATPKLGDQVAMPDKIAEIDLEALREQLAESLEKADATDVTKLQQKIAQLQRQLKAKPAVQQIEVEVPVITDDQLEQLETLATHMIEQARELLDFGQEILELMGRNQPAAKPAPARPAAQPARVPRPASALPAARPESASAEVANLRLRPGETKILTALARIYPTRVTRPQVATLAGYAPSGGTFGTYFGNLKRNGLLDESGEGIIVSADGLNILGEDIPAAPQTTDELIAMWQDALPSGAGRMLSALVEHYPEWVTREELGELCGFAVSGGTFGTYLGMLRRNGLIEEDSAKYARASSTLFLAEMEGRDL